MKETLVRKDRRWMESVLPSPAWGVFPDEITGLSDNSKSAAKGDLYFLRPGKDGVNWSFLGEAIRAGVRLVVTDSSVSGSWSEETLFHAVPVVFVKDLLGVMGSVASSFWGNPSGKMKVVAVTGTNGKTTSSFLTQSVMNQGGIKTGLIGTVVFDLGGETVEASQTTPGILELHRLFAQGFSNGLQGISMEVSSHALDQDRIAGLSLSVVHFTNLTRDHLDYHLDMESYYQAKKRLFFRKNPDGSYPICVVNGDDPWGKRLVSEVVSDSRVPILVIGEGQEADIAPLTFTMGIDGIRGAIRTPKGVIDLESPMTGHYNLMNIMGVIGCALALEIPLELIARGISAQQGVPGRFEVVRSKRNISVIVDYAHTDDALENLLSAVRPLCKGRVITVFGCGGDRDRGKRPRMGEKAGRLSDLVVLTSDNPRTEDPESILDEIEPALKETGTPYERISDRKAAIFRAISLASPGDSVVIAGKGHENYQILGKVKHHFDDREIAREALESGQ
ncbi:MAG: UDP-N-acetylmuramoyl-L-alanyl-D-glutamate--2,6-diaminopimelate ligase [Leptospirillum sp.]